MMRAIAVAYLPKPHFQNISRQHCLRRNVETMHCSRNSQYHDYIAYRHVFAFIHFEADSKEKLNHSVNAVVEFYRHSVSLDDDEANALARIALETETRTLAIEQQAAIIITRFRETIDAELKSGRTPSAGPPELQALQKQRVSTTLRGRDELRKAFGESTFSKFDRFLKDGLNLKIETVTSSPHNN